MKTPLQKTLFAIFTCLLFSGSLMQAQDTIVVQTLTWADDFRSGNFEFPDNPNQTYRKILMLYNMRCHDVAVGSGNVGCREWDYSCNTFITDDSRVDSNLATAPNYIISNFDGDEFEYTNQTTYTYQEYQQHVPTIDISNEMEYALGTNSIDGLNINGNQGTGRFQFLYTADELTTAGVQAGDINALRWFLSGTLGQIDFLRIRLKHTSATELLDQTPDLEGFTQVYFQNTSFGATDPKLDFYQPFNWDGTSNILVDVSYTQSASSGADFQFKGDQDLATAHTLHTTGSDNHLEFSGSGQVYVADAPFDQISEEVTVAFWNYGNPDILPANSTAFEAQDSDGLRQLNVHLPWGNSNIYWDCGNDGSGYDRINALADTDQFEGQWNHWAFTKNTTTGDMSIFVNGELWLSGTDKTKNMDIQDLAIGSAIRSSNPHYGKMDDFAIWSKALDASTIQSWMRREISDMHPNYDDLVVYFPMNEGTGTTTMDSYNDQESPIFGGPSWRLQRGKDLFKNFEATTFRPVVHFVQGDFSIQDELVTVVDSFANAANMVVSYEVQGTDLVAVDTSFYYAAADQNVLDESGQVISTIPVAVDGSILIETLQYYNKFPAKYEILSLVTPYGNGLDLGPAGATFTIDVTEYAPILKGEKFMSIEMGGQNQEELDIKFLFITGTPPRDIVDIQNVWPFRRGWYADIQADNVFEPRDVPLDAAGDKFVMRSAVTGHGQNGEFVPRFHYISFNEGAQEVEYYVWKECGDNPMYPQGGTWLFDRAGWCPGLPTDIHEIDFTIAASPGGMINMDYGVNGTFMDQANYLVSNQLVTYGPLNFSTDASIESVIRPTTQHEYQRINPACNLPIVEVRNNGANTINSIEFAYQVEGSSTPLTYTYENSIFPEQTVEITLPVDNSAFWITPAEDKVFQIEIVSVNGGSDENGDNDSYTTPFILPELFDETFELQLYIKTNNRATENAYTISDYAGNVVLSRNNMANATEYEDDINLPPGCYTLAFEDTGDDGLSYWYWDLVDPSVGSGQLKIRRNFNGFPLNLFTFETEFGGTLYYDFAIGDLTDVEDIENATLFTVYPNPASDQLTVELQGFQERTFLIEVIDLNGRVIYSQQTNALGAQQQEQINTANLSPGMYYVRVSGSADNWVRSFVKQ